jgi:hypothetical protein
MRKPRIYRRLAAGHQFGVVAGGWLSLHLASDHLLLRQSGGFTESYRRFYFNDIEAITIRKTYRWWAWNLALGFALFLCIVPMVFDKPPHYVAIPLGSILGSILLLHLLHGPTCVTHLKTKVQTRPLPLRRTWKALRVVRQLSEKITAAQADIAITTVSTAAGAPTATAPTNAGEPPALPNEIATAGEATWLQISMVGALVLTGTVALLEWWWHIPGVAYFVYALALANLGLAISVLVQQRRQRLQNQVTIAAWASTVSHAVALPLVYTAFNIVHAMQAERTPVFASGQRLNPQLTISALRDLAGFNWVLLSYGICALILAFIATVLLMNKRNRPTVLA